MPVWLAHAAALLTAACMAALWQGAALAVMATALLRWMPRASAGLRHTLLVALYAAAVVLPWIPLISSRSVAAGNGHALRLAPWVGGIVAGLWLVAALGRGLQLFLAWRHLCAVRRHAVPLEGAEALSAGGRRAVLCASPDVDAPMILGFRSPRLLLPEWMLPQLSPEELRQIALHECEHLRRRDDWLNLLLQVGLMLSPLNPALVWLNRRIGVQRELAVDAAVVAMTAQPIAYAACLTRLAERRMRQTHLRLALAAWERRSELVQRVHALLQQPSRWNRRQSAMAATAAALVLLTASTGIARVPQLVQVAEAPVAIAASQPPSTVVPEVRAAMLARRNHAEPSTPVHMVAASFQVKSTSPRSTRLHIKRKRTLKQPPMESTSAAPAGERSAHMVRISATVPAKQPQAEDEHRDEAPVRLVTTEFSMPYVAVPVANGWLLIQL